MTVTTIHLHNVSAGREDEGDGLFPTNDAGWLDEDGYLYVEGLLDDVIVRGGENISPGEIEDVLRTHPAVADVAVLGLQSDVWGETVAAAVVCRGERPVAQLEADFRSFIARHNDNPKPFKWTRSADEILASVKRFCQKTEQTLCSEL